MRCRGATNDGTDDIQAIGDVPIKNRIHINRDIPALVYGKPWVLTNITKITRRHACALQTPLAIGRLPTNRGSRRSISTT